MERGQGDGSHVGDAGPTLAGVGPVDQSATTPSSVPSLHLRWNVASVDPYPAARRMADAFQRRESPLDAAQ